MDSKILNLFELVDGFSFRVSTKLASDVEAFRPDAERGFELQLS